MLIGYGLCSVTVLLAGSPFILLDAYSSWSGLRDQWPLLLLTTAESFVVQWLVVQRRLHQWDEPVAAKRLLLGCLAGKLVITVPWLYLARYLNPT